MRGALNLVFKNWWTSKSPQPSSNVIDYVERLQNRLQRAVRLAHDHYTESQNKAKLYYDKKARYITYQPCEAVLVLKTIPNKPLSVKYQRPYEVVKQTSPVNYLIHFAGTRKNHRVIHVNLLKKYHKRVQFVNSVLLHNKLDNESDECGHSILDTNNNIELI